MREFLYRLLFPHPNNNHKAHLISGKSFLIVSLFLVISSLLFSSGANPFRSSISVYADVSLTELLSLTNEKRLNNNLTPLVVNEQLNSAAGKKAEDMFDKNYWAHNSPDGVTPWIFIKGAGYDYVYAGENLARGFSNANDVVNAWMASPSHRENLLSPNYDDVGFAVRAGKLNGEDTILVVQEFGSKNAKAPIESPENIEGNNFLVAFQPLVASINNLDFSDNFVIIILLVLVVLLILDIFMIEQKKIVRFAGHNEDHIMYIAAIIVIIFIMTTGAII